MERILLVGENKPFLESISDEFEKLGFKAFTAGDEDEGLNLITSEVPDVMILSYGIKRFNPLKLVFKLREVNLLAKLVYLHPENIKPLPPDDSFYIFVPDSLPPDLIVTKIVEAIDNASPIGEMTIKDVLWILNFEKRSAFVRIFTDEAEGEVIVKDGEPVSCKLGINLGDEALSNLVGLETIAYEISWDIPQEIERNVTQGIEVFVGEPFSEEKVEEEDETKDFEDITKELERDIEELTTAEPKEFTLNEFSPFEEKKETTDETWDLNNLEDIESNIPAREEELKPPEESTSPFINNEDIFKNESEKGGETFPEGLELGESELTSDFEFPEEISFEEVTEEELSEEIPGLEEMELNSEEKKEELPFTPSIEEQEAEQVPIEEEQSIELPEKTEMQESIATSQIYEERKALKINIDEALKSKLINKGITGLSAIMIVRGDEVIYTSSEKDIEELERFLKDEIDEALFKLKKDVYVLIKSGGTSLIGKWKQVTPGYALFMAKKLFREIQP